MTAAVGAGSVRRLAAPAGVRLHLWPDLLVVDSERPLGVASTAVLGGGLATASRIVALTVPVAYRGLDPAGDIRRGARARGWEAEVGLMTAVGMERAQVAAASAEGVSAVVVATAGVSRPWSAGAGRGPAPRAGTINLVVLLDARVEPAAALNLLATVTEAKVLALLAAGIRTPSGEPASGTATDAVVVAWPAEGPGRPRRFGGPATPQGWAAAAATRAALRRALEAAGG